MSTCREVENRTAKRFSVLEIGENLEADEAAEAHSVLVGVYLDALERSAKPGLTRVLVTSATYTAGEDELIAYDGVTSATITLPVTVVDTKTGLTRAPKDRAVVMIPGTTAQAYVYDEMYGDWVDVCGLAQTDYAPFSNTNMEALSGALAMYLASEYSRPLDPMLAAIAERGRNWLYGTLRKGRRVSVDGPLLRSNRAWASL